MNPSKVQCIFDCVHEWTQYSNGSSKRGRPFKYSWACMLLFFMAMMRKGIYSFKGMALYAELHYAKYGFEEAPSRFTIRRRFYQLPGLLQRLIPHVALQMALYEDCFCLPIGFIDKSIFKAKGGVWHKKQMLEGIIPHSSIDTQASWGKSPHHGWRFGYSLHVICNASWFPMSACVTTASVKDTYQLLPLTTALKGKLWLLIADKGYKAIKYIKLLFEQHSILLNNGILYKMKGRFVQWISTMNNQALSIRLYKKRKTTVEPLFSLIKELFDLKKDSPLPYKGLDKVQSFLMLATFSVQVLMVFNKLNNYQLRGTHAFFNYLD